MGVRAKARIFLFQCRYASLVNGDSVADNLETLGLSGLFDRETRIWVQRIAEAATKNSGEIADMISPALSNWSMDRLSMVTRLLLEQAVAEVRHIGTPAPVVIRESVRMAEEFDQPGAGAFINGVLHRILIENGGFPPEDPSDK